MIVKRNNIMVLHLSLSIIKRSENHLKMNKFHKVLFAKRCFYNYNFLFIKFHITNVSYYFFGKVYKIKRKGLQLYREIK